MTTKSLTSNSLRFSKIVIVLAILALGLGLESASAALLTQAQAKAAAAQISHCKQYNAAFAVARDVTANTGAEYAATNAWLIAKYLKSDSAGFMVAIINGVSYNYPNQQAAIANQVVSFSKNAPKVIVALGSSLSYDAASQLAVGLNYRMLKSRDSLKKAAVYAYSLLSVINNSSTGSAEDRANEMAITAANLASNLLTPDRHGVISKLDRKAFDQIAYILGSFAQTADTGSLTRDELINNLIGNFAEALKASVPPGSNYDQTMTNTLNRARAVLLVQLPSSAPVVNKVIQDVINSPTGSFDPAGPVNPPETPH